MSVNTTQDFAMDDAILTDRRQIFVSRFVVTHLNAPLDCRIDRRGFLLTQESLVLRGVAAKDGHHVHHEFSAAMMSSAVPREPEALPSALRVRARRMISGSAPCWTAIENVIAAPRAFVSALELLLWC
jgi:hypothetical protein